MRNKIFISYSHKDSQFRERLELHLKALTDKASFWADTRLEVGDDWESTIHSAMEETAVAILLISADFMASDFIRHVELPRLFAARDDNGIIIIPVMLYECNCGDLLKYQFINTPDKPLGKVKKTAQEEVFARLSRIAVTKLTEYIQKEEQKQSLLKLLSESQSTANDLEALSSNDRDTQIGSVLGDSHKFEFHDKQHLRRIEIKGVNWDDFDISVDTDKKRSCSHYKIRIRPIEGNLTEVFVDLFSDEQFGSSPVSFNFGENAEKVSTEPQISMTSYGDNGISIGVISGGTFNITLPEKK